MKFLAIKNQDNGKLGGLIVRDNNGKLFFTAVNSWFLGTLDVLLTPSKFKYETRIDDRTIRKIEMDKKDERIFGVLKTKILPPYVPYAIGSVKNTTTPKEVIDKVWSMLSKEEHQEVKES